ncbi:butyrophilin subfamily 3 member A2-like isoform X2 [Thunnus maccoyii]|uniref:butyrophilin subfamily 3 member A2-like isoform X2 n=1 Tax=Thunnus maccoyii TaxID=8240 RepID=UPI001C4C548A|nr:butyrophilin subfamily 3 member A2-like isoform X2 [Thunnus maccoyii]
MTDITQQNCRMPHQTNRPSLQSPLKILSVLFVHLLLTHSCKGQSQLIGSSQPIVATVGDDNILPCHLEPAMDVAAMILEWTRSDLDPIYVHVCRAGQDVIHIKNPSYKGRTSLFTDELKQGNISLKLSKVKLSDGGKYKCNIPKLNKQSFVELFVGAVCSPVISLAGLDRDRGGVVLQCESKGWHPQPEVFWLDGEGNLLSAGPTETVRGPDDLYTVSSRVTVEKRHNNNFTCRVQQNNINQTRETHIIVSDDFFKLQSSSSPAIIGLAVCLAVCIVFISLFFVWKLKQNKTKRSRRDETEGGSKNVSKSNDTQMQPLNAEGTEGETVDPTVSAENKRGKEKTKHIKVSQDEVNKLQDEKETEEKLRMDLEKKNKELKASEQKVAELQKQNISCATIQRSVRGDVFVEEVDLNGKYVCLSNKSNKEQELNGCELQIRVNDGEPIIYRFDSYKLKAGQTITIRASDSIPLHKTPTDLVGWNQISWGPEDRVLVTLFSSFGEEMAMRSHNPQHRQ